MTKCHQFADRRRADEPIGLDSRLNSIVVHHALILAGVFAWGVLAACRVKPPGDVSSALHGRIYWVWVGLHVLAPPVVWLGQAIVHRAARWPLREAVRGELPGWLFQSAGDLSIALAVVVTGFAFAATGNTLVALFMSGLAFSAASMATRDLLKVRRCRRAIAAQSPDTDHRVE